jgi:hypothetical protein
MHHRCARNLQRQRLRSNATWRQRPPRQLVHQPQTPLMHRLLLLLLRVRRHAGQRVQQRGRRRPPLLQR